MNVNTAAKFRQNGKRSYAWAKIKKIVEKSGYYNIKEITMVSNILFILHFNNISDGVSKNVEAPPQE